VINSSRSERGWRGRRRIAVLISIAGVLGVAALGTAGTASAATVANCSAKLTPHGKGNGTSAKLSFVCDAPVRAYTLGSNKPVKDYTNPSGGAASQFFTCEGTGFGFGCGVPDRAAPGTQTPGTTGWSSTFPPAPSATATPTTCGGYTRTAGAGTSNPDPDNDGNAGPNVNGIVGPPCTEQIGAGTKVTQLIKLGSSPCAGGSRDPLQLYLFVGGEPAVTGLVPPTSLESTTVGEFLQSPITVSQKAFKHRCGKPSSGGGGGGKKSSAPPTKFPVICAGSISPATTPGDQSLTFSCNQTIRAFAVYSNKSIDLPGDEPIVTGTNGGGANEGALHQCEGAFPGAGYGCGIVDRQQQTTGNAGLPNGQAITAGNTVTQTMGFDSRPCKRPGESKAKAWLVVMGEPATSATAVGEYSSAPRQLALNGFGKCKGGKGKGGKKK
jgi:hypothetical protein